MEGASLQAAAYPQALLPRHPSAHRNSALIADVSLRPPFLCRSINDNQERAIERFTAAEAWKAWICANDANVPEMTLGACQTLHFVEDWTRAQIQLWEGWFAALESLAPGTANQLAETAPRAGKPRTREHVRAIPITVAQPAGNGVPA